MSAGSQVMPDVQEAAPVALSVTGAFYWSVRRELWENRWIYLGQLVVAGVFLLGFVFNMSHWLTKMRGISSSDPAQYWATVAAPFDIGAGLMMGTLILMSLFYSADALHGERRDRSIFFWKSLPVPDWTTVLAKASIPLLILPVLTFAVTVVIQVVLLLLSCIVLPANGISLAMFWKQLNVFQMWGMILYHLFMAHALWPFPVFCWLLSVSGWARRAPLLWAALPVAVIGALERLVFGSANFFRLVGTRLIGGGARTDVTPGEMMPTGPMTHLTPLRYLGSPGLWMGLLVAAVFLVAAVRMRRYRDPV